MQMPALAMIVLAAGCAGAPGSAATPPHGPGALPSAVEVVAAPDPSAGDAPPTLLIHVEQPADPKRRLSPPDQERLRMLVQDAFENARYATDWPGGLPSMADLATHGARAFIVAATIDDVDIQRAGASAAIDCSVMVRIAPWYGIDGGEHWETATAAMAKGRARATTSAGDAQGGVRDCVLEVSQEVTTRQILPFLERLQRAGK